jgi:hypothetical protein
MRNLLARVGATLAVAAAVVALSATPVQAGSFGCWGECSFSGMPANASGHFIDVYVQNPWNWGDPRWCSWTLRDSANNALVGSGTVFDEEDDSVRIPGLYGKYTLFVSNSACFGHFDNEA